MNLAAELSERIIVTRYFDDAAANPLAALRHAKALAAEGWHRRTAAQA